MPFNSEGFFQGVKALFGGDYKQSQLDGMTAILDGWAAAHPDGDERWLAYMFATTFHETNQQMQPVREAYWLSENWRRTHLSYYPYYGRGFVQLTHKDNYRKAGDYLHDDLVNNQDFAMRLDYAAKIMFVGMEEGWFRASKNGKPHKLSRYFSGAVDDPVGARAIINGKEIKKVGGKKVLLATVIAQYHAAFLEALKNAQTGVAAPAAPPPAAGFAPLAAMGAEFTVAPAAVAGIGGAVPAGVLGGAPAAPAALVAPAAGGFVARARDIALGEWRFFGSQTYDLNGNKDQAGHTEGEDGFYQRVGQYWLEGTNTHGLDGRNHDWPWSGTFISWLMKQAGAGTRFTTSRQHSVYISQGIRDYKNKRDEAGYWTQRLNEAKPVLGDIVCWSREDGVDYDHQKHGDYKGHSDLVVDILPDRIWIIGGNVGNSVTRRPLMLDVNGYLPPMEQNGEKLFGIMKCRIV